jgi:hypothetical protein
MSGNFSSAKAKTIFDYTFPYYSMFAIHAVNYDTYGIRTSLTLNRAAIEIDVAVWLEVVYDFSGNQ